MIYAEPLIRRMLASRAPELTADVVYGFDARPGSVGQRPVIAVVTMLSSTLLPRLSLDGAALGRQSAEWLVTLAGAEGVVPGVAHRLPGQLVAWYSDSEGSIRHCRMVSFLPPFRSDSYHGAAEARLGFVCEIGG